MDWRDHIVSDPRIIGGKPAVKGTRIGVGLLLRLFGAGWTTGDVLESYPHLTEEDLRAVFAYAADVTDEERTYLLESSAP